MDPHRHINYSSSLSVDMHFLSLIFLDLTLLVSEELIGTFIFINLDPGMSYFYSNCLLPWECGLLFAFRRANMY